MLVCMVIGVVEALGLRLLEFGLELPIRADTSDK